MALSPELKLLVSGATAAVVPDDDTDFHEPSIREQLAWLGLQKASKSELREIIVKALERDPDA